MQYMFHVLKMCITCKYCELVYGIGAEEFGHVEMLATMIAQLLEKAPVGVTEAAVQDDPTVAAVVGGTDVQHAIVAGAGARPADSMGNPWSGAYVTASGNLLVDFSSNANAEMQGRVQVARLYHMSDDPGVRDLLAFLLARDTMHQNQWLAAIEDLKESGVEELPVPSNFPISKEHRHVAYQYINFSDGQTAADGPWASGPTPDGKGEFSYVAEPPAGVPMPPPTHPDSRFYGTTELPNVMEKAAGKAQDALKHE